MKHVFLILLVITILVIGICLPYLHGNYDYFAVGISYIFQFAAFTSLLLVPIGLLYLILRFVNKGRINKIVPYPIYLGRTAFSVTLIIVLISAVAAFASNSRFLAIAILCAGIYFLFSNSTKIVNLFCELSTSYYFIFIPLTVIFFRLTFLEKIKDYSTNYAIKQCELLILDIETYKKTNGHYPLSLLSTIEDYKPSISGISQFHYELKGDAYNIYFEQTSTMLGTEEIVMYNKLDEQEMTVHNQDLLRIPYNAILHGHHKVVQMPNAHWKIFYFD